LSHKKCVFFWKWTRFYSFVLVCSIATRKVDFRGGKLQDVSTKCAHIELNCKGNPIKNTCVTISELFI
jgi:hypothetical protein